MSRAVAVRAVLLSGALVWATACSDGPPSPVDRVVDSVPGLVVSSPVAGAAGTLSADTAGSTALVSSNLVYVSLVPGSVPTGLSARITHQVTSVSVTTAMVNGGFDPVAIVASIGDTLLVEIARDGDAPLHWVAIVPGPRPPVVVRTSPPRGGRDVPLNARMVIVFSQLLDPATVDTGSVKLWRGSTPVPGTVRFADVEHLRVEFHPDDLLAAETDYVFVLSQGIRDVTGEALEGAVTIPFTTGTTAPATGLVFASVSAGPWHACGITTSGEAYCWGENSGGQLGNGTTTGSATPVPVLGGLLFQAISAGEWSTCGVATSGTAYCWGSNDDGQLGDGTFTSSTAPVRVAGNLTFASVSTGRNYGCGVTVSGSAFCWGRNSGGQLGAGTFPGYETGVEPSPLPVVGDLTFASVSAGRSHACGITTGGQAHCWGFGLGSLGNGDSTGTWTGTRSPLAVVGGLTFASVTAGWGMSCGVTTSGANYCWGLANFPTNAVPLEGPGLDWPDVDYYFPAPTPVAANPPLATLSISWRGCGLTASGAAYCWEDRGWSGKWA